MWRDAHACRGTRTPRVTASKAPATRVARPAVHVGLDIGLCRASFGGELLLLPCELWGVEAGVAGAHARCHGVTTWIHRVVGIGHRVPEDLTLGCVGHSPHRGDHGEGAGRLIGVLLPRDRVIRK